MGPNFTRIGKNILKIQNEEIQVQKYLHFFLD